MKRHFAFLAFIMAAALLVTSGCAEPDTSGTQARNDNTPVVVQTVETVSANDNSATNPPTTATDPAQPPGADENTDSVVAESGFGKKGHYDSNDYISTTIAARFRVEERIALMNITRALQVYKQINNGYPKTHEIFMEEVIKANSIRLPELNAGEEYLYDPELAAETNGQDSLRILKPKK